MRDHARTRRIAPGRGPVGGPAPCSDGYGRLSADARSRRDRHVTGRRPAGRTTAAACRRLLRVKVARHVRSTPGNPRIADEHDPDAPRGERTPKPTNPAKAQFPAIGPGAAAWLVEAAAAGTRRIRAKMADAIAPAKLHGAADVDRALGTAATVGRFAESDLLSIVAHQGEHGPAELIRRSETHSLQPGTSAWSGSGS